MVLNKYGKVALASSLSVTDCTRSAIGSNGHSRVHQTPLYNWNDRRSRRVFLCFYSAIFQLTSAKFQTFAYNSRTVWSSNMKFCLRLMSYMFLSNFEAICHVTSVLQPKNRPASLA